MAKGTISSSNMSGYEKYIHEGQAAPSYVSDGKDGDSPTTESSGALVGYDGMLKIIQDVAIC